MIWSPSTAALCLATSSIRLTKAKAMTTAAAATRSRSPMIVDTDVGFDDLLVLQCLLTRRQSSSPSPPTPELLVTTVGGVVSAPRGANILRGLFPHAQIASGLSSTIMPYDPLPAWLVDYRTNTLDAFVEEISLPPTASYSEIQVESDGDARSKAVDMILNAQEDNSVDILCIGPLTNLASWLTYYCEHDDNMMARRFASKINSIHILGGNHPTLAHTLQEPEFNFGLDPEAARHVITSPLLRHKIHLVTSSVCNMAKLNAMIGKERIQDFVEEQKCPKRRDSTCGFYPTLLKYDSIGYSLSCDPVCAFALEHPECATWEHVSVRVDASSGKLIPAAAGNNEGGNDEEGSKIRIASNINLEDYLSWISSSVDSSIAMTTS